MHTQLPITQSLRTVEKGRGTNNMKSIKSQADIQALQKAGYSQMVISKINEYFTRLMSVYGQDYDGSEGYIVLLEKEDPSPISNFWKMNYAYAGAKT